MKKSQFFRKPYRVKKRRSILKNRFFWLTILVLIISGGTFYLIFLSSYFQIKEIKISGNEKVASEKILSPIQEEISQKLLFFPTKSIFLVNLKEIKKTILDEFPQIASLSLKRKFPETLEVEIEERKPIAVLPIEEGYFLIDQEGIVFEEVPQNDSQLPQIKISGVENKPELGEKIIETELLSKILAILSEFKNLAISVREILVVSDERINLKTSDGWETYFNPQKDINWQLTKLKVVLEKEIPAEKIKNLQYIELRFGDFAPFKYR